MKAQLCKTLGAIVCIMLPLIIIMLSVADNVKNHVGLAIYLADISWLATYKKMSK